MPIVQRVGLGTTGGHVLSEGATLIDRHSATLSLYFKSLCFPDVNIRYSQKMVDKDENKQVFCSGCLGDFLSNATSCPSCRALSDLLGLES